MNWLLSFVAIVVTLLAIGYVLSNHKDRLDLHGKAILQIAQSTDKRLTNLEMSGYQTMENNNACDTALKGDRMEWQGHFKAGNLQ